jgi:predicted methyltransferase
LSTIDEILWSLQNGKWYSLTEIIEKSPLPKPLTEMALSFLREYNFIQIDEKEGKAKLSPPVLNFIDEIQRVEKEETSSHKSFEGTVGVNEFASLRRSFKRI